MIKHTIFHCDLEGEISEQSERILFGMGCFWGVERCFWQLNGVLRTAAGYAGGHTNDPNYSKTCSGNTGHAEVVEVVYDPQIISTSELLKVFWEHHDPTQGMRQGNDRGSQYRSLIVCYNEEQMQLAEKTREIYQQQLDKNGLQTITTELLMGKTFYLAEEEHQQYLDKNPGGYCGLAGTGTCLPG